MKKVIIMLLVAVFCMTLFANVEDLSAVAISQSEIDHQSLKALPPGPTAPEWCTLVSPSDWEMDVSVNSTLEWSNPTGSNPDGYDLSYSPEGGDWINVINLTETSYNVTGLNFNQAYEWKVEPFVLSSGTKVYPSGNATSWWFYTEAPPRPSWANNTRPFDGETSVSVLPTLTWEYSEENYADRFEIYLSSDNGSTYDLIDEVPGTMRSYTFTSPLNYYATYTWGVLPYYYNFSPLDAGYDDLEDILPNTSFTTTNRMYNDTPVLIPGTEISYTVFVALAGPSEWFAVDVPVGITDTGDLNYPIAGIEDAFIFGADITQSVAGTYVFYFDIADPDFSGHAFNDGREISAPPQPDGTVEVQLNFSGTVWSTELVLSEEIEIVCPNVTNMSPANGSVNLDLTTSLEWDAIPELQGLYRIYRVRFADDWLGFTTDTNYDLTNLEYSTQNTWSVYSAYVDDLNNPTTVIQAEEAPQVCTFYTKAGAVPEAVNEDNPIEKIVIDIPDGATPKVPVIAPTLPTEGFDYQPLAMFTYDFDFVGTYNITLPNPAFVIGHVYANDRELVNMMEWWMQDDDFHMWYEYDGAKGDVDIVITSSEDATLPVELSSFDAVMTSAKFAQINWQTASESNLLGYNIFRAESTNQDEALRVTPTMIQATNSSMGQSYSFLDDEVEMNTTYNYWLQANDFNGTTEMFGPVSVKISDNQDHDIQDVTLGTQLYGNYPNPFNPSTNISFSVAEPQVVTIEVYNMKGQLVKTLLNDRVETPNMKVSVVWNGLDDKNNKVSSGIYLYKLVTDNYSATNKMILMK